MDTKSLDIDIRVLLLAIYKKQETETSLDILKMMENSGVFSIKQGKKYIKILKELKYMLNHDLTLIGLNEAKIIEKEFTI